MSGELLSAQHYDPYGVPLQLNGLPEMAGMGYAGEQTDSTGLVYLRARHYDPTLGIMLSLDPFEGVTERPMSLNGYSYAEGNPVNWTDPSGMQAEGALCAAFIAGDGPFPFGDIGCAGLLIGLGIVSVYGAYQVGQSVSTQVAEWLGGRYYSPPGQIEITVTPNGDIYFPDEADRIFTLPTIEIRPVDTPVMSRPTPSPTPTMSPMGTPLPFPLVCTPMLTPSATLQTATATPTNMPTATSTPDSCSRESIHSRIGVRTVGEVVGIVDIKSGEPHVSRKTVIDFGVRMCKNEPIPPAEHYVAGDNVTLNEIILSDGNHKFVASRLMNYPLGIIPSTSPFGVVEADELPFSGSYDWSIVRWR